MPQFITPEMLTHKDNDCAHDITVPEVSQDYGDSVHRAYWTLSSKCKRCEDVFVYDTQFGVFGLFDDLKEGVYVLEV